MERQKRKEKEARKQYQNPKRERRPEGDNVEATNKLTLTGSPRTRSWSVPPGTLVKRPRPGKGSP